MGQSLGTWSATAEKCLWMAYEQSGHGFSACSGRMQKVSLVNEAMAKVKLRDWQCALIDECAHLWSWVHHLLTLLFKLRVRDRGTRQQRAIAFELAKAARTVPPDASHTIDYADDEFDPFDEERQRADMRPWRGQG